VTEVGITTATIINCNDLGGNRAATFSPPLGAAEPFSKKRMAIVFFKCPDVYFHARSMFIFKKIVEKKLWQIHLKTRSL